MSATGLVQQLWQRMQARDWDGLRDLLAEDFVLEWPDVRRRLRGRDTFVEFNRSYPEGWAIEVLRVVGDENTAVSEVHVPHPDVGPDFALSFFEVDEGRIVRGREFWVEEQAQTPSEDRSRFFAPM